MPKLKVLSGNDIIKILEVFGFSNYSQRGSHIKLKKFTEEGAFSITIPNHKEIDKGTVNAIIRQISAIISQNEIKKSFYTE